MSETLDKRDPGAYDNGLKCSWCEKSVGDMSREELIAFIGMLDDTLTMVHGGDFRAREEKLQTLISAQRKVIEAQDAMISYLGGGSETRQ